MARHWSFSAVGTLLLLVFSALAASGPKVGDADEKLTNPTSAGPPAAVNSKRFRINYEIRDLGPSGVAAIELWFTRDGREWKKGPRVTDAKAPLIFDAPEEGRYGFVVIVHSGAGRAGKNPQPGDDPQRWVEVDVTPPRVMLYQPELGDGREVGRVTLRWSAIDRNLAAQPISLYYAERPAGPWHLIAEKLENTGRHAWAVPPTIPARVHLRVAAADRAGNKAVAETKEPVLLDMAETKGLILGVEPVDKDT